MAETFFESPLYVYFALVLAELVLAVIWHERRNRLVLKAMLIPPALAVVVGLVAHFVVTDREKIELAALDIADAIEQRQPQRIPEHLDDSFLATVAGMPVSKPQVVAVCNTNIMKWSIERVTFHKVQIEVDGSQARMHLTTFLTYNGGRKTGLIWDLRWVKRGDEWFILEVDEPKQGFEM